jgi:hypothetical protein
MSGPSELFWKIVPPPLLNVTLPFDLCFVYKDKYYRQIDSSFLPLQQLKYSHMLDKTKAWWKSDNKSETGSEYLLSVCSQALVSGKKNLPETSACDPGLGASEFFFTM